MIHAGAGDSEQIVGGGHSRAHLQCALGPPGACGKIMTCLFERIATATSVAMRFRHYHQEEAVAGLERRSIGLKCSADRTPTPDRICFRATFADMSCCS